MRRCPPSCALLFITQSGFDAEPVSNDRAKCLSGCSHYSPGGPEFQGSYLQTLCPEIAPETECRP
jgi:hypothetical protein